jgi:hypothetical protein
MNRRPDAPSMHAAMSPAPTPGVAANDRVDHQHIGRTSVERVKGIEPSSLGWEPRALPLSYTRADGEVRILRQDGTSPTGAGQSPSPDSIDPNVLLSSYWFSSVFDLRSGTDKDQGLCGSCRALGSCSSTDTRDPGRGANFLVSHEKEDRHAARRPCGQPFLHCAQRGSDPSRARGGDVRG